MTEFKVIKWVNSQGKELSVPVEETKVESMCECFKAEGKEYTIEDYKL